MRFTNITRRAFLKLAGFLAFFVGFTPARFRKETSAKANHYPRSNSNDKNLGTDPDGLSRVYIAEDGTSEQNMKRVVELMGGVERIIEKHDIVVLKPNAQWWNQGMTNTDAMKAFIELVLNIPGFDGELIIADNHHYEVDDARGWSTEHRNGKYNYNELVRYFNERGFANITKYHWHDAGPNPSPRQGDAGGGRRVRGPDQGDGYVWCKDMIYKTPGGRKCMMTYPVFTSAYSGTRIDLKNGAWENGAYSGRSVKLINFSAINHHSSYCGVTASVKNLMGVVDMTCGHPGTEPPGFYNTHYIGEETPIMLYSEKISYYLRRVGLRSLGKLAYKNLRKLGHFNFFYTGGCLGYWMRNVRFPDLNIITAEWVGWGGRTDLSKRSHTKSIVASKDPVALDYYASKYILLPATKDANVQEYYLLMNDPDNKRGPFYKFLQNCQRQGVGNVNEGAIKVVRSSN